MAKWEPKEPKEPTAALSGARMRVAGPALALGA